MFEHRSNAFVEAMNGLLQQAKRAARGFRNVATFISIAYPRNLHALSAYLTPACRASLQEDYESRRSTGELRQRVRGIYEIPGRGFGENPTARVAGSI